MINIKKPENNQKSSITWFFQENLDKENKAIYSEEFFCPLGLKKAIKDKNVVIIESEDLEIVAGLRFYLRLGDNIVSVYQFAIDKKYKGVGLLKKMLKKTGYKEFEVLCPVGIGFNNYYKKTNWVLKKIENDLNHWILKL